MKLQNAWYAIIFKDLIRFKATIVWKIQKKKMYFPEDLNVKEMFTMFKQLLSTVVVVYETYRCILNSEFNKSFEYPQTDTCITCDEFLT
jgi:hypothetical protein